MTVSLALFFALGEIVARQLSFIDRMNAFPRQLYAPTGAAGLAYTLRPGVSIVRESPAGEYEVRVNRLGFRGAEIETRPSAGMRRALVLGDSVAFGEGLVEAETYPVALQRALREQHALAYEVINAGVSGYNTAAAAALLRHRGLELSPTVVVLAVSFNDFGRTPVLTKTGVLSKTAGESTLSGWLRDRSEFFVLLEWLITYARGEHAFQKMAAAKGDEVAADVWARIDAAVADRHRRFYANPRGPGWTSVRQALTEIRDLTTANDIELLVVLFPEKFQVSEAVGTDILAAPQDLAPQRAWQGLCDELKLECLDLLPAFQRAEQRPLFLDMQHPNATGLELAARVTAAALARSIDGDSTVQPAP